MKEQITLNFNESKMPLPAWFEIFNYLCTTKETPIISKGEQVGRLLNHTAKMDTNYDIACTFSFGEFDFFQMINEGEAQLTPNYLRDHHTGKPILRMELKRPQLSEVETLKKCIKLLSDRLSNGGLDNVMKLPDNSNSYYEARRIVQHVNVRDKAALEKCNKMLEEFYK